MVDTHCHIYKEEIENYEEIIKECKNNNIDLIINGVDIKSDLEIIELSKKYSNVFASVGLNYDTIDEFDDSDLKKLEEIIKNNNVVAIGEIGLDYHYTKENKSKQIYFFKKQLELALKYNLPVIVHAREATQDAYNLIKEVGNHKGSLHCFSGSLEMAREFIKLGFKIGVDGPITFKNNRKGIEVVENIDIKDILTETDSPYLAPVPKRGEANTPLNLKYIIEKISEVKNMTFDEVNKITTNNAKELFNI